MEQLTVTAGSKSFDIPRSMILGLVINKKYDAAIYPFIYLSVNLPGWMYAEVARNPKAITVTMDLKAKFYQNTIDEMGASTTSVYKGNYKAVTAVDTPITDIERQMKLEVEDGAKNKNYLFNEYYLTDLCLYNTAYYNAYYKPVNAVITSGNMTAITTYALQASGITNTLMSTLSNTKTYSEFKLPPITGTNTIENLIETYGLHKNRTIFFMDLDRAYLINTTPKCEAWSTNEYKITHIMIFEQTSEGLAKFSGYYANSKEKYHLLALEPSSIQSIDLSNTDTLKYDFKDCVQFFTEDAIFEALTPNKEFIINIDSSNAKNINGSYYINKVEAVLSPGGEYLDAQFKVTLIR